MARFDYDIAIVGCGPVGALLANLLGAADLKTVILEREAGLYPLPRAVGFDGEIMRIFQSAGLGDVVASIAHPVSKGTKFVNARGEVLLARADTPGPGMHGWASHWLFHQPDLERVLRDGFVRYPNVELIPQQEVTEVEIIDGGASLAVKDMPSGGTRAIKAKYVVGCDGTRSVVKRAIGSTVEDLGFQQPWLVVDVLVDQNSPRVKLLPDHSVQHCDPERPATYVCHSQHRRRWEIMLLSEEEVRTFNSPEHYWPLLAKWLGPEDAQIERAAVYTFRSLVAIGWQKGPLFLAGDSCHQTPPFMGQGMCAGMRDAANLAWKLQRVVKGDANEAILDTYESERRPHVLEFIKLTVELGRVIQIIDAAAVQQRDLSLAANPKIFVYPRPQLGPGIHEQPSAKNGIVFSQPRLSDGRPLDEATLGHFVVLGSRKLIDAADDDMRHLWREIDAVVVADDSDAVANALAEFDGAAVVLRPDAYVFGVANDAQQLRALSRHLQTALRSRSTTIGAPQSRSGHIVTTRLLA